jgi:hypothetical protein
VHHDESTGGQIVKRTTVEQPAAPDARPAGLPVPPLARPAIEPVRTRRRPLLVGLGVALTALGGLGAAWLATSGTGTVSVVGVRHEIRAGATIGRDDLVGVQVASGSGLRTLPVDHADTVIGKRSLVRLLPGSLLNPDAVADKLVPSAGQALVGLSLGPAQRPALPFDAGDPVEIVYTPGGTASDERVPAPVAAVVVSTTDDPDNGRTIVNVTVPADAAARVATWGSAGKASVVLLSAGQG